VFIANINVAFNVFTFASVGENCVDFNFFALHIFRDFNEEGVVSVS
jgi:hypothetical protein